MTILSIQIEPYDDPGNVVFINPVIINKLNLPINKPFYLSFGNKATKVVLSLSLSKGNLLRIPSNIAKYLLIPDGVQLHAKFDKNKGLQLGPILGILVQSILFNQPQNPFGNLTTFAQEVLQISKSRGTLAYVFTLNDINHQNENVTGWIFQNNKWNKKTFPIPDVVYNRISSRKLEKKFQNTIFYLQKKYNFEFFNSHFLDKWEVYQKLSMTPIKKIIPKTIQFKGHLSIKEMLNNYSTIYLKPTNGALGRGIIKIGKKPDKFTVILSRVQGPVKNDFKSFSKMYKYLKPRISYQPYLVQYGLDLINLQNRPIDFRILVQKNEVGNWGVTSMVARIANDNHIVSNLAQGGTQSNVMETIQNANPNLAKKITRTIFKNYALSIANYLESETEGNFTEFGIDLALDKKGKVWLLEVNSKPSKNSDSKTNEPRPSVSKLIQYTLFISGFRIKKRKRIKKR